MATSLPFAPEIVLPTLQSLDKFYPEVRCQYGFKCSLNPTFAAESPRERVWISDECLGINQGPVVLMIENYRSALIWHLMRRCPYIVRGLNRANFRAGWLDSA